MTGLEWLLCLTALLGVTALSRGRRWGWLLASLASLGYVGFCWHLDLKGQSLINLLYVLTQLWGWWHWQHQPAFRFSASTPRSLLLILPIGLLLAQVLQAWDAWLTAATLIVQVLTSRGVAQAWRYWVVLDLATAGLYVHKEAWATAMLYLVFAGVAESAHRYWRNPPEDAGMRGRTEKEPRLCTSTNSTTPY